MTNQNKIPSPEEIRNCLPNMEYFTQESEEIASVIAAIEDGILGGLWRCRGIHTRNIIIEKKSQKTY